ncbi:MAG: hypothetical protein ABR552_10975 [Actinomycetota bacterium]|nr:hypothetical protein [Actinomycetota bacterium]
MRRVVARAAVAVAALAVVLSGCQANVRLVTTLDGRGGGTFAFQMTFDKQAIDAAAARAELGVKDLDELFNSLGKSGWTIAQSQPKDGGLVVGATHAFKDPVEFASVITSLRRTKAGSGIDLDFFDARYETHRTFFRTRSTFTGAFHTATKDKNINNLLAIVRSYMQIEVRVVMPGAVNIRDSFGSIDDGAAVWLPQFGTDQTFSASASAWRLGSMLLIVLPSLLLLAGVAWLAFGRRGKPLETKAIVPDEKTSTIVLDEPTVDQLLAIQREATEPIVIDQPELEPVEKLLAIERDPTDA